MGIVVLIPSYNPQAALINLVKELHARGMEVLVVNDGSGDEYKRIFDRVREYASVVEYKKNRGKGYAIKTGIRRIASMPGISGFVTADGDGQHTVEDIVKIAGILEREKAVVLGVRCLSRGIPWRSRVGNDMSKFTYTLVTGRYLKDNQSGLRGFPAEMAAQLLKVGGSHYEYEMNVLTWAALRGFPIIEVPIRTIYENNNKASHFRPLLDTVRIQGGLLLGGAVPSVLYILCAAGIYAISRHKGMLAWSAVFSGILWLLHFAYRLALIGSPLRRRTAAARVICGTFIRHVLLWSVEVAMLTLVGSAVLCVLLPLLSVNAAAFLAGKLAGNFAGNRVGRK